MVRKYSQIFAHGTRNAKCKYMTRSIMLSPKRAFGSTPGTSGSTSFLHLWHHLRCTRYLIIFAGLMIRIVVTKRVLILAVLPFRGVLQSGHTSGISGSSLSRVLGASRPFPFCFSFAPILFLDFGKSGFIFKA